MRRREVIRLLAGSVLVPPSSAWAQQAFFRRLGILMGLRSDDLAARFLIDTTRTRLQELGWREGQNLRIEDRWSAGDSNRLQAHAVELVRLNSDVILCEGTPVVAALQQATRTIPIVFVNANNPVGSGFVESIARPGGNITGFVSFEPNMGGKWLETLKEIAPHVERVGLVYNPQTHSGQHFQSIKESSQPLGVETTLLPFREADEIERALTDFADPSNGGVLVLPDNSTNVHRELICRVAARNSLPAVYPFRRFISSGGLAYYGADTRALYLNLADYVDRVLRGEKPANLPVQQPTKFELVLNLRTARALGLSLPSTLLARADEVIE